MLKEHIILTLQIQRQTIINQTISEYLFISTFPKVRTIIWIKMLQYLLPLFSILPALFLFFVSIGLEKKERSNGTVQKSYALALLSDIVQIVPATTFTLDHSVRKHQFNSRNHATIQHILKKELALPVPSPISLPPKSSTLNSPIVSSHLLLEVCREAEGLAKPF